MPLAPLSDASRLSHTQLNESDIPEIRVKTAFSGQIFITYIDHGMTFDQLVAEMREICGFHQNYPFTMKWVDEEGDPCTINSQIELDEAIRLYEINKEAELAVHGHFKVSNPLKEKSEGFSDELCLAVISLG
eukprot:snap_masked-scaffold82_size396747-processed-gene-2.21 protein:Tk06843 transcript:snap_masked-scaffold82_size396747-processed-gene-2.21-mRNA-1 annotation:"conserved hypothetical protein"